MEKLLNPLKPTRVNFIISLFFLIFFSSTAFAQNTDQVSVSGSKISAQKNVIEQPAGISKTSATTKNRLNTLPKFGPELQEIAGTLLQYLVLDAETAKSGAAQNNDTNEDFAVALTSSFINNQLMDGMRLEFHANPLNGGGSILFTKAF